MKAYAWNWFAVLALVVCLGCGQSSETASSDDSDLTNSEAAALVADETKLAKEVAFNTDGAPTVEFSVPDMMCEHSCVPTVRETLAAQPGVKDVKVELTSKTATVAVDKDKFDPEKAVAALVDLQFTETELLNGAGETSQN
jgi:copper chaperone CopZ